MKSSFCKTSVLVLIVFVTSPCRGQQDPSLPLSPMSLRQILRAKVAVPQGRSSTLNDVIIRHYRNSTRNSKPYRLLEIKRLLGDPAFDINRPTVVYAHGYVELTSDDSVQTVVSAYLARGGYNVLVLDWANLGFGSYFVVALNLPSAGEETAKAISKLLKAGLSLKGLHLVGHSMGVHLLATTARWLMAKGYPVPRLTGLDAAYPGFYPPLLGTPASAEDAIFFDVIHTDGGGYGAPASIGHADFWPNHGTANQPGCQPLTVPLTFEDFCSHWRSWAYWSESVRGGEFLARPCGGYDDFLRGNCSDRPLTRMGLNAKSDLRGNFYLRTAAKSPFALAERGAE